MNLSLKSAHFLCELQASWNNLCGLQIYPDPELETEILALTTHCSNYSAGCKWTGKLQNLKVWSSIVSILLILR